jgi:signal transduction histidine kinase/CheY-like chemotaxis protein
VDDLYRTLFESSTDALVIEDIAGNIVDCNPTAAALFQIAREQLTGKRVSDLVPGDRPPESQRLVVNGRSIPVNVRTTRIRHNGEPAMLWNLRDINDLPSEGHEQATDWRSSEERTRGAHRMEAIGRLAGGVAHDFNNLLTVILGRCEMILDQLTPGDPTRPDVLLIHDAADKAAAVTRQLLAFGRGQVLQPQVIDLNAVVCSMKPILMSLITENVRLRLSLDANLLCVEADRSQMEQVIMNLVVNAIDAMPAGGELEVSSHNEELASHNPGFGFPANPGMYSVISVRDTGRGIAAYDLRHVFEPFFTTKNAKGGTGLGLSTVYGIVKQSGGYIRAISDPGEGATFMVYLPGVRKASTLVTRESQEDDYRGMETILVAEDAPVVRQLTRELLENRGYSVVEASSGEEALSLCASYDGKIDLMLSDVIMPGMNGHALALEASRLRPDMKVLLMSGYADEITRSQIAKTGYPFLAKPFTSTGLSAKVRHTLDG